jgi:hypothetical protein
MSVTKVTGMMQTGTKGGDIPSASTLVIDTDGDYFDITGTTGITAMTVDAGRRFTLQFDGAVTLTHGVSLYLPGATNFTTEANDSLEFIATAANTVRCTGYALKDGGSVVAAGLSSKVINGNYVLNTASGTVDYTGVGFQPTACLVHTAVEGSAGLVSIGYMGSTGGEYGFGMADYHRVVNDGWASNGIHELGFYYGGGSNYVLGNTSFISDGVRVTYAKTGTMSGTASITFWCLK